MCGCVVRTIIGTMTSSDSSKGIVSDFALWLIPKLTQDVGLRPFEASLVASPSFTAFRSPYARESIEDAFQILLLFHGLHPVMRGSALSHYVTTLQDSL